MNNLLDKLTDYLDYLRDTLKLNVSVHFTQDSMKRLNGISLSTLLEYNSHTCPYCMRAKAFDYAKCLSNQLEVIAECKCDAGAYHTCYAGIKEYVYPFFDSAGNAAGYVAASGYRADTPDDCRVTDTEAYDTLVRSEAPPTKILDALIPPLCIMLELLMQASFDTQNDNEYRLLLQFLTEYHTNISLDDICRRFGRSASHVSHMFKKNSGVSIRAFCNDLKLRDSERMLRETELSITDIALGCGFNDVSYFIKLFGEKYGVSPHKYRVEHL